MIKRLLILVVTGWSMAGCTLYYYESNLNQLSPGIQEQQFLASFPTKNGFNTTAGATVRASKVIGTDRIDVLTLPLARGSSSDATEYWFVFKNQTLVQWGKPEDWKNVAATYQIDFNPTPGVRPPH